MAEISAGKPEKTTIVKNSREVLIINQSIPLL